MIIQLKRIESTSLIIVGFITSLLIISKPAPIEYEWLWVIPLTYSILFYFCFKYVPNAYFDNVSGIVFNSMMILRTIVMPLLIAYSGFPSKSIINMHNAIMLFEYEIIVEFIVFSLYSKKKAHGINNTRMLTIQSFKPYLYTLLFLFFFAAVCLILSPMGIKYYRTIFGITDYAYTGFDSRHITALYATNLFRKFGLVTIRYVVSVVRIVVPCILILYFAKYDNMWLNRLVLIVSIFIFNFLIVDDTIATSVFNSLIIIVFYKQYNGTGNRGIMATIFLIGVAIGAYYSIRVSFKTGGTPLLNLNNFLQAYFGGLDNISAGLNMSVDSVLLKGKYAIYEVLKGVPYASTIFHLDNTNISTLFNETNTFVGQIVPTICSSKLYFGYFLAPIYPLVFVLISLISNDRICSQTQPLSMLSNIVISIYSLMGTSVYSPEITWTSIICVGLMIKLLSLIFEKKNMVLYE